MCLVHSRFQLDRYGRVCLSFVEFYSLTKHSLFAEVVVKLSVKAKILLILHYPQPWTTFFKVFYRVNVYMVKKLWPFILDGI